MVVFCFLFTGTATSKLYTLSLHDALPIYSFRLSAGFLHDASPLGVLGLEERGELDRKSTRLNSSHGYTSYAVFCLKKKKERDALIVRATQPLSPARVRLLPTLLRSPSEPG